MSNFMHLKLQSDGTCSVEVDTKTNTLFVFYGGLQLYGGPLVDDKGESVGVRLAGQVFAERILRQMIREAK